MPASKSFQNLSHPNVQNIRCPACRKNGAFHAVRGDHTDATFLHVLERNPLGKPVKVTAITYGIRVCPNLECQEPLFSIGHDGKVTTFPVETVDFDAQNIPSKILESFSEAITCQANFCFKAAALMVRRTLEEICADREATGANLKERISALSAKVILPKELLEAADELRLLGNDAAHMEAKIYDDVGEDEVAVSIELCKEILKGVYQLSSLVDRLRKLKKGA